MARIDWKAMERQHVRFEAELDQLKAKMLEVIAENGEDWLMEDVDATLLHFVTGNNPLLADIARFAKIGIATVLESFDPTDGEGNPIIRQ